MRLIPVAFLVIASSIGSPASAATFCAGTTQELQNALATASSNGQHDTIRIRPGFYAASSGTVAFAYSTSQSFDLVLEGGWQDLGTFECAVRQDDPRLTILDGGDVRSVLQLTGAAGTSGDLIVRNLTVRNGSGSSFGGLRVGEIAGYVGDVAIEQVIARDNNSMTSAGGIAAATDGGTLTFRNNLVVNNTCGSSACGASLLANLSSPFNNYVLWVVANTVALNTCPGSDCAGRGGMRIAGNDNARKLVVNNALFFNEGSDLWLAGGNLDLAANAYEALDGAPQFASGNLVTTSPGFVNALAIDFALTENSPLIDAGSNNVAMTASDLAGRPRLNGPRYDIGAYEAQRSVFADGFEPVSP